MTPTTLRFDKSANREFAVGVARAFGGALIFSLPMMMTMEMWWLGFYMRPQRLAMLIIVGIPILTGLAYYSGFEDRNTWKGAVVDAFVAYAVGLITAAIALGLMAVMTVSTSLEECFGKIILQAIPGGFGAVLAISQFGSMEEKETDVNDEESNGHHKPHQSLGAYGRELFLMIAGALLLAFNVSPTEEMVLVAYQMTAWHAIALVLVSILIMHAFVYVVRFSGQESIPDEHSATSVFFRFTIVGYALAMLVSLYCLWTFGRTDGTSFSQIVVTTTVLAFPASIGAAAARLVL